MKKVKERGNGVIKYGEFRIPQKEQISGEKSEKRTKQKYWRKRIRWLELPQLRTSDRYALPILTFNETGARFNGFRFQMIQPEIDDRKWNEN